MPSKLEKRTELTEYAFGAASAEIPWSTYLEKLCDVTDSDKAYIAIHSLSAGSSFISYSFNIEDSSITTYNDLLQRNNPWVRRERFFQAAGLIWKGNQIVPEDELRETDFYQLFMAPEAMLHTVHMVMHVDGSLVSTLVLTRRHDAATYSEAELDDMRDLVDMGHAAFNVAAHFNYSNLAQSAVFDALDSVAAGVAVLVDGRRSIRSNAGFRDDMKKVETDGGTVFFQDPPERAVVKLPPPLVRGLRQNTVTSVIVLPRLNGGHPVAVHIRRYVATCAVTGAKLASHCLLSLDPQHEFVLDDRCLHESFELTPAEVRVAAGIAACKRIETIAADLGITPSTARTHLKRIFDKTGARRQSELVRLMSCVGQRDLRSNTAGLLRAEARGPCKTGMDKTGMDKTGMA